MTTEDIINLVNAGYTKEEILQMDTPPAASEEPPAPKEPDSVFPPVPMQAGADGQKPEAPDYSGIADELKSLRETLKALQAENVKKATGGKAEPLTADRVIMDFFGAPAK